MQKVGDTSTHIVSGQIMTVVAYRAYNDMDVQFEDGTIVTHCRADTFRKGMIAHPKLRHFQPRVNRIGEIGYNSQGLRMKIIGYKDCTKIDVEFEDGTIVRNKRYYHFLQGYIFNPNVPHSNVKKRLEKVAYRIGEERVAKNGLKMKIIDYKGVRDITVQFEDGAIAEHQMYDSFLTGGIKHPTKFFPLVNHIGDTVRATNGLLMTVTDYHDMGDVSWEFEDGCKVEHADFRSFKKRGGVHQYPFTIGCVVMEKPAYVHNDEGNFYCHCTKCGLSDIMSLTEIRQHNNEH